jgi:hypothetical protein
MEKYCSLLDSQYTVLWKKILYLLDFRVDSTTPVDYINYLLYAYGVPFYWLYELTEKQAILAAIDELNAARYTDAGLTQFISCILDPDNLDDVQAIISPKSKMFLEFSLYGFPNSEMRDSVGLVYGDQHGYIPCRDDFTTTHTTTDICIFSTDSQYNQDKLAFLSRVLTYEIKNIDFNHEANQISYQLDDETLMTIDDDMDTIVVTGVSTDFETWFAPPYDKYYFRFKGGNVERFNIVSVDSDTSMTLEYSEDFSALGGGSYATYRGYHYHTIGM